MRISLLMLVVCVLAAGCATPRTDPEQTCSLSSAGGIAAQQGLHYERLDPSQRKQIALRAMSPEYSRDMVRRLEARMSAKLKVSAGTDQNQIQALILSTGGGWGAFGSGFLLGAMPPDGKLDYDIVTGASAGAIVAPFAFVGERENMTRVMTLFSELEDDQVIRRRGLISLFTASALFDTRRLQSLIRSELTDQLIEQIAAKSRTGAALVVLAVNLDTGLTEIFDLSQISINTNLHWTRNVS